MGASEGSFHAGRGVGDGLGRLDLSKEFRLLGGFRHFPHDPSPASGSRAWWEGEALPVTPEEDEAWDALLEGSS